MATFDRFDICLAYAALEMDFNEGGLIPERGRQVAFQLHRMHFREGAAFNGWESLSSNAREIYNEACERMHLGDSGYKPCACDDCFEIAIGRGRPLCHECQDAGCGPDSGRECRVERLDDEEGEGDEA